ncbi:MAG: pyrroline-5-carboxylate reductase [Acidimicrobiales bacterium]
MARLAIVGGGRMGEALVGGLLDAGWARPDELVVVERLPSRRAELAERFPGLALAEQPVPADAAVLAVKPVDTIEAARAQARAGAGRLLSIAAGVSLASLEAVVPATVAVVRAMPNTPALIGMGASAVAAGANAGEDDMAWAEEVLGAVGTVVRVAEAHLDAVTGLSGSGPAYVFLFAESLVEAGVLVGLPRDVAEALAEQTLRGSAELLARSGEHPAQLRNAVTSPGGTTAAGLQALETGAFRAAILTAVQAATERARHLGA